jgi:leader peptidase (prepilin peptidase)/N-methyltransferase
MELYYLFVFFAFGLIFGSFYNVVGYRLPNKMSLISPSSHCPQCNHKLTPLELIPVFSYLFQGGKCKNCKKKIPIFYPIFELFTGIVFALIYKSYGITIDTFIALVFASMILIIMVSDILYMIIPDELLIFSGIAILILKLVKNGFDIVLPTIVDMIIPAIALLLIKLIGDFIFKRESMGWGDVKLMLIFGMVLGWELSIFTIFLSSFLALPISIINLKRENRHELPLGPYLGLAALICLITKVDIITIFNLLNF